MGIYVLNESEINFIKIWSVITVQVTKYIDENTKNDDHIIQSNVWYTIKTISRCTFIFSQYRAILTLDISSYPNQEKKLHACTANTIFRAFCRTI